jgi:hypothetical protein
MRPQFGYRGDSGLFAYSKLRLPPWGDQALAVETCVECGTA